MVGMVAFLGPCDSESDSLRRLSGPWHNTRQALPSRRASHTWYGRYPPGSSPAARHHDHGDPQHAHHPTRISPARGRPLAYRTLVHCKSPRLVAPPICHRIAVRPFKLHRHRALPHHPSLSLRGHQVAHCCHRPPLAPSMLDGFRAAGGPLAHLSSSHVPPRPRLQRNCACCWAPARRPPPTMRVRTGSCLVPVACIPPYTRTRRRGCGQWPTCPPSLPTMRQRTEPSPCHCRPTEPQAHTHSPGPA